MYQSGVATSVVDLLDQFRAFLVSEGWTLNSYATIGSGKRLHINKDSVYIHARAYLGEATTDIGFTDAFNPMYGVFAYTSTGYDGGSGWTVQPGAPTYVNITTRTIAGGIVALNTTSIPYHFFAFDDPETAAYLIAEYPTGIYQHLWWGRLVKHGTYTGGLFAFGPNFPGSPTRRNVIWPAAPGTVSGVMTLNVGSIDAFTGWGTSYNASTAPRLTDSIYRYRQSFECSPNGINSLSPLEAMSIFMTRGGAINRDYNEQLDPVSDMGYMPNLYSVNMTGMVPGGEYPKSGSGEDYRVFPMTRLNPTGAVSDTANPPHSRAWGVAIRSD